MKYNLSAEAIKKTEYYVYESFLKEFLCKLQFVVFPEKFFIFEFQILSKMKLNLPDKLYYSIGEVAKAFDVNASLIRYWEQEFPIIKPKKNKKGNRYFTPEDIKNLKMIYHLVKEKGYTLDGARIALTTNKKINEAVEMIDRLEFVKSELLKLKSSLVDKDETV